MTSSVFTKQFGTSSDSDNGRGVTIDSTNNIYLTGFTRGALDGNTHYGGEDIFIVKYNSNGSKQWTKQLGTSLNDSGWGIVVDSSDNIYVAGSTAEGLDGYTNSGLI